MLNTGEREHSIAVSQNCPECGFAPQFHGWRGLSMLLICPRCGNVVVERTSGELPVHEIHMGGAR